MRLPTERVSPSLRALGLDVVALGSHGLAVDLDAAAVDVAAGLTGAGRKAQVLEQASEVDLALVVNSQLNMLLGEVGELALLEHAVELGLSLVAGTGAVVGVAQVAAQSALELIGIGGAVGQSSVDLVDLGRG